LDRYDAIVIGLGAMGSSAVYQIAGRKKRVLGLEQYTPGHHRGSSHGRSRVIRLTLYRESVYIRLLQQAYELWTRLERDSGRTVLTVTGGLALGRPTHSVIEGGLASAKEFGLSHEVLDAAALRRRFPFNPDPDMIGVYEPTAGFLNPEQAIYAYFELAAQHGADLHFNEPVLEWMVSPSGDRVVVVTTLGAYETEQLIITPGPWATAAFTRLNLPFEVERLVMFWFMPPGGVEPFLPVRFPVYVCIPAAGERFYGFPAHEGPLVGVKVAFSRKGTPCTPETIDREVHESEIEFMRAHLATYLPALNGPCLATQTCMYTNTPDLNFVIGRHPAYPRCFVAAGFSGHGFKFASVVGEILADFVADDATRYNLAPFDPSRFAGPSRASVLQPFV
jgi:sarcosine oxidase